MRATAEHPALRDDTAILAALREGDEAVFMSLVRRYHGLMLRVARGYVSDAHAAEDVVKETWLGVLDDIHRFEPRSSLRTWIFRTLVRRAATRATKDRPPIAFGALGDADDEDDGPTVDPERFLGPDHPRFAGHWAAYPADWDRLPHERLVSRETMTAVRDAIERLPERQRTVVALRDIGGLSAVEVCEALGLGERDHRLLLHRGRAKVRRALERALGGDV
jgi:RNA polymerase sigma-70 factor (ECF subfamily)